MLIQFISKATESRHFVIDLGVHLEEIISLILSYLLDIDPEKNKSLGDSFGCLSFNQKVTIIQDKKGIDRERVEKLQKFMEIRNKFAHIKSINSFQAFNDHSKECAKTIKKLNTWYCEIKKENESFEETQKRLFYELFSDNSKFLMQLGMKDIHEKAVVKGKSISLEEFLDTLREELIKTPETFTIWEKAYKKLLDKYPKQK